MNQQKKHARVTASKKRSSGVRRSKIKKNTAKKKAGITPAAFLTFLVSALWLIDLISRIILANVIGDEGLGSFGLACAAFDFGIILTMEAIPETVKQLVEGRFNRREFRNIRTIYQYTLFAAAILCGIISVIVFIAAPVIVRFMFGNITEMILPLRIAGPAFFITGLYGVMSGFSQGLGNAMPSVMSHTAEHIIRAIVSVAASLLLIGRGLAFGAAGGMAGILAGVFVGLMILFNICRTYIPWLDKRILKDPNDKLLSGSEITRFFTISLMPAFIAAAVYEAHHLIDAVLFADILTATGYQTRLVSVLFGVYSGKFRLLTEVFPLLIITMITGLLPEITSLIKINNLEEMQKRVDEVFRVIFSLALPAMALVGILAGPFAELVFGAGSALTNPMFITGCVIVLFMPLAAFTSEIIRESKHRSLAIRNTGLALLIHIVFAIVLLAYADLNVYALIYATVVFYFAQCALNIHTLKKIADYDFMVTHLAGKSLIFTVIAGAVCFLTYRSLYVALGNCISVIPAAVVFIAVYGMLMIIFRGLTEEEIFMLPYGQIIAAILYRLRIL